MNEFGWIADGDEPPPEWDLRARGWALCLVSSAKPAGCGHPVLVDARHIAADVQEQLLTDRRVARRLIFLGVEDSQHRASLLARGCGDVLPDQTTLAEIEVRTRRLRDARQLLPRTRPAGPLILDLFHRDARLGANWLSLHPREFGVLWRLADTPGERATRRDLLRDVWRIHHEPETNSVEVHVSRLRSKLAGVGCEALVETVSEGGYRLTTRPLSPGQSKQTRLVV